MSITIEEFDTEPVEVEELDLDDIIENEEQEEIILDLVIPEEPAVERLEDLELELVED